jgi:AcrR family transcriptional regulator
MMGLVSPRSRTAPSREEKKAQTRARLLDAAAVVFAKKGFAGASLDDVADEAGLTKGAVYSNFANKTDLIRVLLDLHLGVRSDAIPGEVDPHLPQPEQAARAGELFMAMLTEERESYLLELEFLLYLARNPDERNPTNYLARRRAIADIMQQRADEDGYTLPLPAEDLATAVFALGAGIALERLVNPAHVPDDLFGRMLAVIFGVAGDQPGKPGSDKR